jgi:hypothetical protein
MTEQSPGQDRPDEWSRGYGPGDRGGYASADQYPGEQYYDAGTLGAGRPGSPGLGQASAGMPGPGGAGTGAPGPGGIGAARPGPGNGGPGMAGPGMPTTPIWQAAPPPPGTPQATYQVVPEQAAREHGADSKGFLGTLFDFSFSSFVTTRIIKVLYVLIMILTVITALVYTVVAFRISATFGFLTLIIGDPLFIIIVMAFWRLILEAFMVVFRIAEDVRAIRERGGR